jgi:hypothetical protein
MLPFVQLGSQIARTVYSVRISARPGALCMFVLVRSRGRRLYPHHFFHAGGAIRQAGLHYNAALTLAIQRTPVRWRHSPVGRRWSEA